jgi:hypothetical protein
MTVFTKLVRVAQALTLVGCGGSPVATDQYVDTPTVASIAVQIDSASVALDGIAQAVATARDARGGVLSGQTFTWQSMSPDIVQVSETGELTPISKGSAIIQATAAGKSGSSSILVRTPAPPDMSTQDFESGTIGDYALQGDAEVIDDPTNSKKGKLVRLKYTGENGDDNKAIVYGSKIGFGQTIFFRGEFFLPVTTMGDDQMQRKLVYFKQHEDYDKYQGENSAGGRRFRTVVKLFGDQLHIDAVYEPQAGNTDEVRTYGQIASGLKPNTWYTLEVQQTTESSIGAGDGILKVWLDGRPVFRKTNMRWSDPAWIGQPVEGSAAVLDPADLYWDTFMVGQQVNLNKGAFDEARYWDNIAFSTHRIGRK